MQDPRGTFAKFDADQLVPDSVRREWIVVPRSAALSLVVQMVLIGAGMAIAIQGLAGRAPRGLATWLIGLAIILGFLSRAGRAKQLQRLRAAVHPDQPNDPVRLN
jgi:hypothetical protein